MVMHRLRNDGELRTARFVSASDAESLISNPDQARWIWMHLLDLALSQRRLTFRGFVRRRGGPRHQRLDRDVPMAAAVCSGFLTIGRWLRAFALRHGIPQPGQASGYATRTDRCLVSLSVLCLLRTTNSGPAGYRSYSPMA